MNGGLSKSKKKWGHWISEETPPLLVDLIHNFFVFVFFTSLVVNVTPNFL